jgi:uncharacterized membrane protein YgcG
LVLVVNPNVWLDVFEKIASTLSFKSFSEYERTQDKSVGQSVSARHVQKRWVFVGGGCGSGGGGEVPLPNSTIFY